MNVCILIDFYYLNKAKFDLSPITKSNDFMLNLIFNFTLLSKIKLMCPLKPDLI